MEQLFPGRREKDYSERQQRKDKQPKQELAHYTFPISSIANGRGAISGLNKKANSLATMSSDQR
jgi:hypothetical protein